MPTLVQVLAFYFGLPLYIFVGLALLGWARKRHGNPNRAELLLWIVAYALLIVVLEGLNFFDRESV